MYNQQQEGQDKAGTIQDEDPMLEEGYTRQYGGYKPHFKGMAPGYFPFEGIDYFYVILFTLFSDGIYIPIWYGLWKAGEADSRQLSIVSTVIAVGFFIIMIALMYFGGRMKKQVELEMIAKKLRELEEVEKLKKEKAEREKLQQ